MMLQAHSLPHAGQLLLVLRLCWAQMDFNADRNLMFVRVGMCQVVPQQCPPLSWTLSNRLADYAPYQLQWYFRQARLPFSSASWSHV